MAYPKLTPIVADGATAPRYLGERFSDVINVKDYGAKGDGVTDDSDAIQAALDDAVKATVFFPKGVYCISKTLLTNGDTNGNYLLIGESSIKWIGTEITSDSDYVDAVNELLPEGKTFDDLHSFVKYNINTYGAAYFGTCMLYVRRLSGQVLGARCIIEGGDFIGSAVVDVAIASDGFHTLIHGTRIEDVRKIGIMIGRRGINGAGGLYYSDGTGTVVGQRSYQAMISDCFLCQYNQALGRSFTNAIGFYVDGQDCQFSNNNICWFGTGIAFRGSGHIVTNHHITIEYYTIHRTDADQNTRSYYIDTDGNVLTSYPDRTNILVDPCIGRSISGWNSISNCYFNGGKYVVLIAAKAYATPGYSMVTDIVGGSYFLKADSVYLSASGSNEPNTDPIQVCLVSGMTADNVHFSDFNVWVPSRFLVRDYFPSVALTDAVISQMRLDVVRNAIPYEKIDSGGSNIINATNLMVSGSEEYVMISSASHPIPSGKYARIGCIFAREGIIQEGQTRFAIPPVKIKFNNRNYREEEATITHNASTGKWVTRTDESHNYNSSVTTMFIDNTPNYVTIRGRTYAYYNIYYGNSGASINAVSFAAIYPLGATLSVYMHQSPAAIAVDLRTAAPGSGDTVIF